VTDTAPTAGRGKLKRPGVIAEGIREEVAIRGDVYEIQLSPEKSKPKVRGPTDHTSSKVGQKKNDAQEQLQRAQLASSPPFLPAEENNASRREAPPANASQGRKHTTHQKSNQAKPPPRRKTHAPKEHDKDEDTALEQLHTGPSILNACNVPKHQIPRVPVIRKPRIEVRIPVQKHNEQPRSSSGGMPGSVADTPKEARNDPQIVSLTNNSSLYHNHDSKKQKVRHTIETSRRYRSSSRSSPEQVELDEDDTENDSSDTGEDAEGPPIYMPGAMDAAFEFLDQDGCSGRCQTNTGSIIRKMCKQGRSVLQDADSTYDTVASETDGISQAIRHVILDVQKEDRIAFKADAYAYLFRALAQYLKVLYDWLSAKSEEVTESLEAMRILVPFIRDLLGMRDAISHWKVLAPQRHKGEKIALNVTSNFIAPLRKVYSAYSARLGCLEADDERRNGLQKFREKLSEEAEEEKRESEAIASRKQVRKRWQDLHIARMLCEPDPFRRRNLAITPLEHLEEKDSNGLRFERVSAFKPRSSPLLYRVAVHAEEQAWTDEETSALLEGVQRYAGIFACACPPCFIVFELTCYRPVTLYKTISGLLSAWRHIA